MINPIAGIESYIVGAAIGFASAHAMQLALKVAPAVTDKIISMILSIPSIKAYVMAHPDEIKAILQEVEKEVEADIDATKQ